MAEDTTGKYAILPEFSKFPALPVRNSPWLLRLLSLFIAAQRLTQRWKPGIRALRRQVRRGTDAPVRVIEVSAAGSADPSPALIYCHGGAFFLTYAAIHLDNAQRIARATGCKVFVVDYRLSTEAPFPAQFDDCYSCLRWVHEQAEELGVDPSRIGVMGDSAGGALAAGLAQKARDEGLAVRAQILLYPVTDSSCSSASAQAFTDTPLWTAGANRIMWDIYLSGSPTNPPPRYASPSHREDLSGLPPAYVETAEFDPLRDEALDYAKRLAAAGVTVRLNKTRGTIHAIDTVPGSPTTQAAMGKRIEAVRELLVDPEGMAA
jgi:acetyl esterase/lipase